MAVLKFNYGLVYQLLSTTKRTLQLNDWPPVLQPYKIKV